MDKVIYDTFIQHTHFKFDIYIYEFNATLEYIIFNHRNTSWNSQLS